MYWCSGSGSNLGIRGVGFGVRVGAAQEKTLAIMKACVSIFVCSFKDYTEVKSRLSRFSKI